MGQTRWIKIKEVLQKWENHGPGTICAQHPLRLFHPSRLQYGLNFKRLFQLPSCLSVSIVMCAKVWMTTSLRRGQFSNAISQCHKFIYKREGRTRCIKINYENADLKLPQNLLCPLLFLHG